MAEFPKFTPEGEGYDYETAIAAGMEPAKDGMNAGHWGSVAPVSETVRKELGLPDESYLILKGRAHPTFDKAIEGEAARGFKVIKMGDRYYSVPNAFDPGQMQLQKALEGAL